MKQKTLSECGIVLPPPTECREKQYGPDSELAAKAIVKAVERHDGGDWWAYVNADLAKEDFHTLQAECAKAGWILLRADYRGFNIAPLHMVQRHIATLQSEAKWNMWLAVALTLLLAVPATCALLTSYWEATVQ